MATAISHIMRAPTSMDMVGNQSWEAFHIVISIQAAQHERLAQQLQQLPWDWT